MPILVNDERNLFTLHTKHSTYQMKVDTLGTLLHTYYGSRIDETDMSCQIGFMDRGFSGNPYEMGAVNKAYSLDVLPQEHICRDEWKHKRHPVLINNWTLSSVTRPSPMSNGT